MEKLQAKNQEVIEYHCLRLEALEAQYEGRADKSMIEEPLTPTPAPKPQRSVSFLDQSKQLYSDYKKYALPTSPRYSQPQMGMPRDKVGDNTRAMGEAHSSQPKLLSTPFPKFNLRDVEIFIIEAEAWFMFNRVCLFRSVSFPPFPLLSVVKNVDENVPPADTSYSWMRIGQLRRSNGSQEVASSGYPCQSTLYSNP